MQSQSSSDLLEQIKRLISEAKCPWNPLQSPEWHYAQWTATLLGEIDKLKAKG
jgi:hypothetical protein